PYMRERPDITYGFVALIFLILLVWHPAHVFTRPLAMLIIAAFFVLGTEVLRRETAREFPDAVMPAGGIRESLRGWWSSLSGSRSQYPAPAADTQLEQLERLASLRDRGVLSQEEFNAQKAALLS